MLIVESSKIQNFNYEDWVNRSAIEDDIEAMFCDPQGKGLLYKIDGEPKIYYRKLDWDFSELVGILKELKYDTTERTGGLKTTSRVFGYQPRIAIRRDFCSATSLAANQPDVNAVIAELGRRIMPIYQEAFPEVFDRHWSTVRDGAGETKGIREEWRIKDTFFTSGIINKNNPLKYHFDAGNVTNVCSCMLAFKGDVAGGHLAFPELGEGFEIEDCSLTIFDGQSLLHGVTPIKRLSENSYRFTLVFYTLQQMWKCEPLDRELARIRNVKTQREKKRAGRVEH